MLVEQVPTELLKTDGDNPNVLSPELEKALLESIKKFGFVVPVIIDKENVIADGEHRFQALRKTGATTIPCVRIESLSEADRKLLRQIMNKVKGSHDWDLDVEEMKRILEGMNREDVLKYLPDESELLQETLQLMNPRNDEEFNVGEALKREPKYEIKQGDIWRLEKHRLMCGDSTIPESVNKLLNEKTPLLMVTDPPYGVNYEPEWRNKTNLSNGIKRPTRATGKVFNDDIVDWKSAYKLFQGDIAYIWHAGKYTSQVQQSIESCEFEIISQIIWSKPHFILSRGDYHWKHEPCLYAVKKGKKHNWQGSRQETTVWQIAGMNCFGKSTDSADETTGHGTQKPIECMLKPIQNNTKEGDSVYDPFGGSGTTLIACEQTNRNCFMMEIDPFYCSVIIERWESLTGKKAELVHGC